MEKASNKFQIIDNVFNTPGNLLHLEDLYKIAGVSHSGYYNWRNSEFKRVQKESQDKKDFELFL